MTSTPPCRSDRFQVGGANMRWIHTADRKHCTEFKLLSLKGKLKQSSRHEAEMEQKGVELDQRTFSCSICLSLLKDPVTIPCGHSYCISCIKIYWDEEDGKRPHSCPQCRHTFTPRPVLGISIMLAALVEQLKKAGYGPAAADHCSAGAEDVACDVCTGRKLKAVKSCLECLASYCEKHLQRHYNEAPLKEHKLVDPDQKLQENICSRHNKLMKIFCRTDGQCICDQCSMDERKGHDTVTCEAERTERQTELEESRQKIQQRIKDKQEDVTVLRQEAENISRSADKAVEKNTQILIQLIRSLEETEVNRIKELESKLEQEITELRKKDAEMDKLSHTHDHNQFLLQYPSVSRLREDPKPSHIHIHPESYFEDVSTGVSELRDKVQSILIQRTNISLSVAQTQVPLEPQPKTRAEFLRYSCQIKLDPKTAHKEVSLSEKYKKATRVREKQNYLDHPDRFSFYPQVLSTTSLTGRCYWEVDWKGFGVRVAVTYKDIERKGSSNECLFGFNDKSWSLDCGTDSPVFYHNSVSASVLGPVSSRIGVYLDQTAGILSFYSISETMTLIHRVQTTFTQPLYAGIYLWHYLRSSAHFPKLQVSRVKR